MGEMVLKEIIGHLNDNRDSIYRRVAKKYSIGKSDPIELDIEYNENHNYIIKITHYITTRSYDNEYYLSGDAPTYYYGIFCERPIGILKFSQELEFMDAISILNDIDFTKYNYDYYSQLYKNNNMSEDVNIVEINVIINNNNHVIGDYTYGNIREYFINRNSLKILDNNYYKEAIGEDDYKKVILEEKEEEDNDNEEDEDNDEIVEGEEDDKEGFIINWDNIDYLYRVTRKAKKKAEKRCITLINKYLENRRCPNLLTRLFEIYFYEYANFKYINNTKMLAIINNTTLEIPIKHVQYNHYNYICKKNLT